MTDYERAMHTLDVVMSSNDLGVEAFYSALRASDLWTSTAGGDVFCGLLQDEVVRTLRFEGWTSERRVARLTAFAQLAGFMTGQETGR